MYDENQHLSNPKATEQLRGGAYQDTSNVGSPRPIKTQSHVYTAMGCIIISILALMASSSPQPGVTYVGFVLISAIHALATLYTGMVLYNEQNKSHPSKDAPWLALFLVLNACLLLYLNARSMFAISLREMT